MKLLKTLLSILFLSFLSCAVKHKEKHQEKKVIKLENSINSKIKTSRDTLSEKVIEEKKEEVFEVSNISYQGNKGDSLVITEINLNTGVTIIKKYQGSGTVTETKSKGNLLENIKSSSKIEVKELEEKENTNNLNVKIKRSKSEKNVNKETFFNWWLVLLLVIIVIAWYLNKKINWVFKLYNQIKNILSLIFK